MTSCTITLLCVILALVVAATATADNNYNTQQKECDEDNDNDNDNIIPPVDYLIIGAGGAGLQTALFLLCSSPSATTAKSSFAILEKSHTVGSFWTQYPRFDELISINKSVRNSTQRYRYDWHSFLPGECNNKNMLGMLNMTLDYFPKGKDWHRYMERVVETTPGLMERIEFGVEVEQLLPPVAVNPDYSEAAEETETKKSDTMHCVQIKGGGKRCARRRIFVATGLQTKDEPYLRALGGIPYAEATKERAINKRVCILGNGNSAFELAQNLYSVADRVTLYGRSPHRLSAVTRYTGDVRVKYLQVNCLIV